MLADATVATDPQGTLNAVGGTSQYANDRIVKLEAKAHSAGRSGQYVQG